MKILVINCGSSSIKFQLFDMPSSKALMKGSVGKIGSDETYIRIQRTSEKEVIIDEKIADHKSGIDLIFSLLTDRNYGVLPSLNDLDAVGHRIGHGGEKFTESTIIDEFILAEIKKYNELAPLHNPHNLEGVLAVKSLIPGIKQVAVFDTSFHQTIPEHAYMYALPYSLYEKYGIRRYGFHGTSHCYVSKRACEHLNIRLDLQKIISCHLGNGSSIVAIDKGKSIDTSMGFTPLEGLIMGTRPGDMDIGIVPYISLKEKLEVNELNHMFNNESGLLGITGVSSDMRTIESADNSDKRAKLARKMFYYRIIKYIGAYTAVLNGLDILIFTGGIGENSIQTRYEVCKELDFLGIVIDKELNESTKNAIKVISAKESKVTIIVVPTNEELLIAEETMYLISAQNQSRN